MVFRISEVNIDGKSGTYCRQMECLESTKSLILMILANKVAAFSERKKKSFFFLFEFWTNDNGDSV